MKLIAQPKSETPLYEQLYNQISSQIVSGKVPADFCLPSIRFVAKQLQISVIPVKQAYELLENDGYIYTQPGKGCFVKKQADTDKKRSLATDKIAQTVAYLKDIDVDLDLAMKILQQQYKKD